MPGFVLSEGDDGELLEVAELNLNDPQLKEELGEQNLALLVRAFSNANLYGQYSNDILARKTLDSKLDATAIAWNAVHENNQVDSLMSALLEKRGLDISRSMFTRDGELASDLTPTEIEVLDSTLEVFGNNITGVITEENQSRGFEFYLQERRDFLSGDKDSTMGYIENKKLRVIELTQTLDKYPKYQKDIARLLSDNIAINLFMGLSSSQFAEYRQIIGDRANVSRGAFFTKYKKRIMNAKQRSDIACRTFFVNDYAKYLRHTASPELMRFFNSLEA